MKRFICCLLQTVMVCLMFAGCGSLFAPRESGEWLEEGAALLGEDIRSGEFVLNGEIYSFPCPLSVWIDRGWQVPDNYTNRREFELAPFYVSKGFALSDDQGHSVTVCVYNDSADFRGIEECLVSELYIRTTDLNIVLPGGVSRFSTQEEVLERYGEPEYTADTADGSYQPYYSFDRDGRECFAVFQMPGESEDGESLALAAYMLQDRNDSPSWDSVEVSADTCAYYVDAALRAGFYGDWKEYTAMGIGTEENAQELYGSEVCYYSEALMDYVGVEIEDAGRDTMMAFDRIAGLVLGKTEWEVTGVELDSRSLKGTLEITLYPTNFIDLIKEPVQEADAGSILQVLEDKVNETARADGIVKEYAIDCAHGILAPDTWHEIDEILMGMRSAQ